MDWYDTLLFLHVLGAFAMVGATAAFWAVIVAGRRSDRPAALTPALPTANVAVAAGSVLTVVFGIWLAIYVDGYELWDAWILAALVLWAISVETGRRGGVDIAAATTQGDAALGAALRSGRTIGMLAVSTLTLLAALVFMIWKPGT
jgi:hypothetical protein